MSRPSGGDPSGGREAAGSAPGPSRRRTLIGAAVLVALVAAGFAASRAVRRQPNVLVIVMDTTRADRCGFNGYDRPTTPRLDEFARDATVFRDAWSPANWTGSAHASLFTGLRVEHHGFREDNQLFLSEEFPTLAQRLSAEGYATASFSNNSVVAPEFGLTRGFETAEPLFAGKDRVRPWARETHEMAADWARTQADSGRPFLLFINDMEPHMAYTPPPEVAARFVRGSPTAEEMREARCFIFPHTIAYDLGIEKVSDAQRELLSDLYDAEIATLDAEVGRLLDRLRDDGLLDSTLVIVTADHGENLGDHHLIEHSIGLHRTLCHVPLVVRYPGAFDKGRVVGDVVRLEDLYPTALEMCGAPVPPGIDGVSLLRDLPGRLARAMQPPLVKQRPALSELFGAPAGLARLVQGVDSVYDGRFHLIRYSDGTEELYDVLRDPGETDRAAAWDPAVAARLRALLAVHETPAVGESEHATVK